MKWWSEHHAHGDADALTVGVGIVEVGEAAHVLHIEKFEDVADAQTKFDVRSGGVHRYGVALIGDGAVGTCDEVAREVEKAGVGVAAGSRIVLVAELSPKEVETDGFAPLEATKQGDAVEDLAVQVPLDHGLRVTVVEKLEGRDEHESVVHDEVGLVGGGVDEQGERYAVPLDACLEVGVDKSPPSWDVKTFEDAGFGDVVPTATNAGGTVEVADGVAEGDDGCVFVDLDAALLGVDVGSTWFELKAYAEFGGAKTRDVMCGVEGQLGEVVRRCDERVGAEGLVEECIDRSVAAVAKIGTELGTAVPLTLVVKREFTSVGILIDFGGAKCGENVILIGRNETVEGGDDVVPVAEGEVVLGKFALEICFAVEAVGELGTSVEVVCMCAVGEVTAPEKVGIEMSRGKSGDTQAQTIVVVVTDDGVDGTEVELVVLEGVGGFDKVFEQRFDAHHQVFETTDVGKAVEEGFHLLLALGEFDGTEGLPIVVVGVHTGIGFDEGGAFDVLEEGLRYLLEGIVELAGGILHLEFSEP